MRKPWPFLVSLLISPILCSEDSQAPSQVEGDAPVALEASVVCKDALSRLQKTMDQPANLYGEKDELSLGGGQLDGNIDPSQYGYVRNRAHAIVVSHLKEIQKSGLLFNTVSTEDYWMNVFSQAGASDLYDQAREEISRAVEAGLEPYYRGETLTAVQFAELALAEIQ